MTQPNIGASSQTMRKAHNSVRMPHETTEANQENAQREGFIDVDNRV
jgi:hypothetical protein